MGELSQLHQIIFIHNRIQGMIPDHINKLKKLEVFQLHGNRLKGEVPYGIHVNATRISVSSFTCDCGYPSFFPASLVCENCLMCCNSIEECTREDNYLNLTY